MDGVGKQFRELRERIEETGTAAEDEKTPAKKKATRKKAVRRKTAGKKKKVIRKKSERLFFRFCLSTGSLAHHFASLLG